MAYRVKVLDCFKGKLFTVRNSWYKTYSTCLKLYYVLGIGESIKYTWQTRDSKPMTRELSQSYQVIYFEIHHASS